MITIIGTAHVFDISERLREEIVSRNPSVIAVELDRQRYAALKSQGEKRKDVPIMYRAMSIIQKKIAKDFGVDVGSEMLEAIKTAKQLGIGVAFIDLPANMIFKKMMVTMSLREKLYFVAGMVAGLFTSKERVEKEMKRYEKNEADYMDILEKNMPSVSHVLIDERNVYMAENIKELEERYGSVIAVVGDGHVPGLLKELEGEGVETVRLKELRNKKRNKSTTEVNFSVSYKTDDQ
ncbi:MAG: TraB/GumN family protein [Candidatus Saliniplasma sp.]